VRGDWVGGGGEGGADVRVKCVCVFWVLEGAAVVGKWEGSQWLGSGRGRSGWEVVGVAVVGKWEGLL
jgi:hypothetical protein